MQTFAYDFAPTSYQNTYNFCYLVVNPLNKTAKYEEN
jgi:hypothetical protein